jgi:hypothetical protein
LDNTNLLVRVLAAGVPLLIIALIAGTAGYVNKKAEHAPVPPLAAQETGPGGVRGSIQAVTGDEITIVAADGDTSKLRLLPDAQIEVLTPITAEQLEPGDWVNGGAIPHAASVLALTGLVLIPDPVLQTP